MSDTSIEIPARLFRENHAFDHRLMDATECYVMVPADLEMVERAKDVFLEVWDERVEDYLGPLHDRDPDVRDDREMLEAVSAGKTDFLTVFWHSKTNTLSLGATLEPEGHMVLSLSVHGFISEAVEVLDALKQFAGTSLGFMGGGGFFPPLNQAELEEATRRHEQQIEEYLVLDAANRRTWEAQQRRR